MSGQNKKSSYELMLEEPRYLYRPWIPVMKSMEAENLKEIDLEEPVLDLCCGDGIFTKCCFRKIINVGVDIDLYFINEAKKEKYIGASYWLTLLFYHLKMIYFLLY
ncbi:MAG: hypothetical protein ACETWC_00280 [Acidobacteriota bacterium]